MIYVNKDGSRANLVSAQQEHGTTFDDLNEWLLQMWRIAPACCTYILSTVIADAEQKLILHRCIITAADRRSWNAS
jgi:hypothetical protein